VQAWWYATDGRYDVCTEDQRRVQQGWWSAYIWVICGHLKIPALPSTLQLWPPQSDCLLPVPLLCASCCAGALLALLGVRTMVMRLPTSVGRISDKYNEGGVRIHILLVWVASVCANRTLDTHAAVHKSAEIEVEVVALPSSAQLGPCGCRMHTSPRLSLLYTFCYSCALNHGR
jgi:hypothetical protein